MQIRLCILSAMIFSTNVMAGIPEKPNFLLIVVDDMGYSDISPFGGEIETPAIQSIADKGLKFTNYYVGPSCSATRSMLLSGNDNHVAGLGNMDELLTSHQRGKPGYEGYLNDRVVSLGTVLKGAGYNTYMAGKWHLGHEPEQDPSRRGFDRSFTLLQGGASHFDDEWMMYANYTPTYREDGVRTHVPSGFYSSEFYANKIISYMEEQKDDKPFLAYLAFTAPHDPLHVPDEWLENKTWDYKKGYDKIRAERLSRMKKLGIVSDEAQLSPWVTGVPEWGDLSEDEQAKEIRLMEIYAAMVANIDHHVGRVLSYLEESGKDKNTIVVFMSDNGANGFDMASYPRTGQDWVDRNSDNRLSNWGRRGSRIAAGGGWAQVSSTPFHLYKHFLAEGGIRSPLIVSGPGIPFEGETTDALAHVMDIAPTFISLAGAKYPEHSNGNRLRPPLGKPMGPLLSGSSSKIYEADEALGWEYNDSKALRMGQYKATLTVEPFGNGQWQVFDVSVDPGEKNDLSSAMPELTEDLIEAWGDFANTVGVVPLEAAE
ncbi:arylsulfatase [Halioglobus maricola]|nr:arylsulfatase [Halioglobus maricola]